MNKWEFLENETKKQKELSLSLLSELVEEIYYCLDEISDFVRFYEDADELEDVRISSRQGLQYCEDLEKEIDKIKDLENELSFFVFQKNKGDKK